MVIFGVGVLQALYDTASVVTTIGFRAQPKSAGAKGFSIFLILAGVGTVLYAFGVVLETIIEGQLGDLFGRRRMEKKIAGMEGHVIVCGWGRVGRAMADNLAPEQDLVVVDSDPTRIAAVPYPTVLGDATDDAVLERAGVQRCRALVAAVASDADNLYLTLGGRTLRPDLFLVARARPDGRGLALPAPHGAVTTAPPPATGTPAGHILIAIGTPVRLPGLDGRVAGRQVGGVPRSGAAPEAGSAKGV